MTGKVAGVLLASLALIGVARGGDRAAADPAAARESDTEFDILEFRVLGNTVLQVRAIERAVYQFSGPGKSLKDVQATRLALENEYHAQGYGTVFVDIPEQEVNDGTVRLRVTEGRIDRVRVEGARYFSDRRIVAAVPQLQPGNVPHLPTLQRELSAV